MTRGLLSTVAVVGLLRGTHGNAESRFYFAYGDQNLVELARLSGSDPNAEIGKEIPTTVPINVPSFSTFKVQFWREVVSGPQAPFGISAISHVTFDRAFATDQPLSSVTQRDTNSFYKVEPRFVAENTLAQNFSAFSTAPAYNVNGTPADLDGDGVQDIGQLVARSPTSTGSFLPGTDFSRVLRGIGLSASIRNRVTTPTGTQANAWWVHPVGQSDRLFDLEWNSRLAVGESYGLRPGETGLTIHTRVPENLGSLTDTGIYRSPDLFLGQVWTNIGAKYNLIGAAPVPEPASALALGLATLALLRRSKR